MKTKKNKTDAAELPEIESKADDFKEDVPEAHWELTIVQCSNGESVESRFWEGDAVNFDTYDAFVVPSARLADSKVVNFMIGKIEDGMDGWSRNAVDFEWSDASRDAQSGFSAKTAIMFRPAENGACAKIADFDGKMRLRVFPSKGEICLGDDFDFEMLLSVMVYEAFSKLIERYSGETKNGNEKGRAHARSDGGVGTRLAMKATFYWSDEKF